MVSVKRYTTVSLLTHWTAAPGLAGTPVAKFVLPVPKLDNVPVKMFGTAVGVKPVQFGNVVAPGMVPLSIDNVTY